MGNNNSEHIPVDRQIENLLKELDLPADEVITNTDLVKAHMRFAYALGREHGQNKMIEVFKPLLKLAQTADTEEVPEIPGFEGTRAALDALSI